jgi:hypothetical protein
LRIQGLAIAAATLLPRLAWACPQCAGRDGGGVATGVLLGSMILLPFGITAVVVSVIRRAGKQDLVESGETDET